MYIPMEGTVRGFTVSRTALGVPFARYEKGSEVIAVKYGITKFHALSRLSKAIY